jgi:hypothetical protein
MPSARVDALVFDLGGVVIEIDFGHVVQAWADAARVPHSQIAERFSLDIRAALQREGIRCDC